jgi:hypothetical protein
LNRLKTKKQDAHRPLKALASGAENFEVFSTRTENQGIKNVAEGFWWGWGNGQGVGWCIAAKV